MKAKMNSQLFIYKRLFKDKKSENSMREKQENNSYNNIENNSASFFEFFFFTARSENEKTSIENKNHTNYSQKSIDPLNNSSNSSNNCRKVASLPSTTWIDKPKCLSTSTLRKIGIERADNNIWNPQKKKTNERVNYHIDSFFSATFFSATHDNCIKSINHHNDKYKSGEHLYHTNKRGKYTTPKIPTQSRSDS